MTNKILILAVEDDDFLVNALRIKLAREGEYEVIEANDGEQGYEMAVEKTPGLIITDIMMPLMDGIEMLQKIRKSPNGKDIPAIVFTNMGYPGKEAEAAALGADYIVKSNASLQDIVDLIQSKVPKA